MTASTLTSWALLVWEELHARQLDANEIFRDVGLDPSKLRNTLARYSVNQMQQLWRLAHERSGDDFGIAAGARWNPTTFHALGFAWLASASLGEALYRLARYGKFVNDGVEYSLVSEQLKYRFTYSALAGKDASPSPPSVDAGIVAMLKMLRLLLGEAYQPLEIHCPHPPNSAGILLEGKAGCPILYGGSEVEFLFDRLDVERSLSTGNSELSLAHEQILTQHLADLGQGSLAAKVELEIINQLPSGQIQEEQVASNLNLSRRTLQRHLADEGTSFAKLLEMKRRQLAEAYIANDALAMSEVAYLLGFSEQANFSRAFKRWFGVSPTQYRQDPSGDSPEDL